jgi:hypothetical protein
MEAKIMKNLKNSTFLTLITLSILFYICFTSEASATMFFKGDTTSIEGKKYTLDMVLKDSKPIWIWKSEDGKSYQIEKARRRSNESFVLTEVVLAKDNTINKRKSSFEIGKDFPKHDPNSQLQQVFLIEEIVGGKVMDRLVYRSKAGIPVGITGLIFYRKGDNASISGKKVTLERFKIEKGIWKGNDNKYYVLEISKSTNKAEYVLRVVK